MAYRLMPRCRLCVVDFISHATDDGPLYFTDRFTDKTSFCLRHACDMFPVSADLSDWKTGNYKIIREYEADSEIRAWRSRRSISRIEKKLVRHLPGSPYGSIDWWFPKK